MAAQPNLQAVRFDLEVKIARPLADVFAYVSDVTNLPEWQESAVEAQWIEPRSRFRERRTFLGHGADPGYAAADLGQLATARPDAFRPDLAGSLNNLSVLLSDLGDREHALAAIQEAVHIYRELAAAWPDAFRSDLERLKNVLEGSDPSSSP